MVYTDRSIMPFGKHKGKQLEQVPDDYLLFLQGHYVSWLKMGKRLTVTQLRLYQYLKDNLDVLEA